MTYAPARISSEEIASLASATEEINRMTGEQVDKIRCSMRITKKEMGEFLGLSYGGLCSKLSGRRSFQFGEMVRLANWWGISLDDLAASASSSKADN